MSYNDAVRELNARYAAGERNITVPADVYAGYLDGLNVMVREGGRPNQQNDWLAFKAAKVRKQS